MDMNLSQIREGGEFELFVPLSKINEKTGEFEAWATIEEIDQSGEIIDLDKSFPYFQALSDRFSEVTKGANFGPLREQHDPNKAAGHLIAPPVIKTHESGARGIYINGLLTDEGTKKKMNAKTLTGVSIGGRYVGDIEKVKIGDREAKKFTADPNHYGVVDSPCVKNALVTVVKADGTQSVEKLTGFNPPQGFLCRASSFHERKEDARICKSDHAAKEEKPVEKAEVKEQDLEKSLGGISRLACILADLLSARSDAAYEAAWESIAGETPNPDVADRLTEAAQSLFDALEAIIADERAELAPAPSTATNPLAESVTDYSPVFEMSTLIGALRKSATAKQLIKSLHVHTGNESSNSLTKTKEDSMSEIKKEEKAVSTEKKADEVEKSSAGELSKAATDQIAKAVGDGLAKFEQSVAKAIEPVSTKVDAIEKSIKESDAKNARLEKIVEQIVNRVAPPKAVKRVTKGEDSAAETTDHSKVAKKSEDMTPLEKMAEATSKPRPFQFETGMLRNAE